MLLRAIIVAAMLIMQPLAVSAVSLGQVDVASHLDEAFFAEIALNLDEDESLSSIFVDLASPIEYRFLEVYRDQAIDNLRTTIKQDKRGLRVEIASSKALRSPYINLVLRVRHGRATHFKKFPIFLALPSIATPKIAQGKPVITAPQPSTQPMDTATKTDATQPDGFTPFDGWARTDHYGPMVYGDTLFTVARRLRTDKRYSVRQVAMALFNKNRDKFSRGNINLIKEGSFLDTPTANEVEALSPSEASAAMIAQTRAWKQLKQQPKFARVAEAQKHRYTKRVRVGSQGEGVRHTATTPVAAATTEPEVLPVHTPAAATATVAPTPEATSTPELSTEAQQRIAQLKTDNDILQATVTANNKRLAELEKRLTAPAAASSDPKLKRLEARLMRIQRQLEQERASNKGEVLMWLIYAAAGIIVLLIVVIGVLMRRQPPHPAQQQQATPVAPAEKITEPAPQKQASPSDKMVPAPPVSNEAPTTATENTKEDTKKDTTESTEETGTNADDPDIDPLTEADVYLRYGMEEEAEAQVDLALQLTPENPAAHAKLIEVRQARDNSAGAEAAKTAALALLTGSALATFEELLASASPQEEENAADTSTAEEAADTSLEKPSAEPSQSETPTETDTDNDEAEASDDDDLLASISTPDSDKELDALLDIQPEPATYQDDDDELQNLLSTVDSDEPESEEDDVLDLSMDSSDDTDLDTLLSSLSTAEDQLEESNADEPAADSEEESVVTTEEPETVAPTENNDLEGDLAFDTSDLDLSKAKVEEPLVNTASVDSDSDLAFDASGLDLSSIVLPSSTAAEPTPAAAKTATVPLDEPALAIADEISLDLDTDLVTAPSDDPEPTVTDQTEPAASSTPATSESTLDISLDMDDLDSLLATDETTPEPSPEKTPKKAAEQAPQSVDDELGSLLDGLDDLDLGGDK